MRSDEARLRRQAERMAAIGRLARTVQHDINNLLTVILANLEMLKRTAAEGAPQRQLNRVEEAARRFDGTSRAILSLIRRPAGEVVPIRLSETLEALQPLLHMILPAPGAFALTLAKQDPPVLIERSAFEEALLALAQQIAEAQLRGPALDLRVAEEAEAGILDLTLPADLAEAARAQLATLVRGAGGRVEPGPDGEGLRLRLPRHDPA
ncbi:histidine kinase dimerization/phospho-acceptor domain-containing protein [Roseicella frigidaeris]|nr:histidine kinase dimerization/phospho-acceptor domain-containing protein [Roseicella frigidaeris]